ncbi:MAG: VPLPA-CTERM-specific exosortase XrtD [Desulfobacterales bacterium]|jgi:exosortase D (VPLPA-CTERM-specific)
MKKEYRSSTAVAFPMLLIAVLAASFLPPIQKLVQQWNTGDNNYCFLIPPLVAYLCWDRRFDGQKGFRFGEFTWSAWGLLVLTAAVGLMVLGELGAVETIVYGGLWLAIVGLTVLLYGRRSRHLAFPLLVLVFMVPLPAFINRMLTFRLKMAATTLAVKIMRLFDISVLQSGNIIDLGIDKLQVVDACSGLRYFVPMIPLALLIGYFHGRGLWRRLALLIVVAPLTVLINGLRIFVSGWLTVHGYQELAQNFFHDLAGWFIFMIAGATLFAIASLLNKVGRASHPELPADAASDASMGLHRAVVLTFMATVIFVVGGWAVQSRPSAAGIPDRSSFEAFPMEIGRWRGQQLYLSQDVLGELWSDDYVSAVYRSPETANTINLLIPYYSFQGTRNTAHAPQSCLLGGGFDLIRTQDRIVPLDGDGELTVRTLLMRQGNTRILASYFFFMRGRVIVSPWLNKYYLMVDAVQRGRTDGALVRAELVMAPGQDEEEAFQVLSGFLQRLWVLLPEYVPA